MSFLKAQSLRAFGRRSREKPQEVLLIVTSWITVRQKLLLC